MKYDFKRLDPFHAVRELRNRQIFVFSPAIFGKLFGAKRERVKYFLERYAKTGLFIRLKKGLYACADNLPSDEELANLLYRPSYISFDYALAHYNIIPESVYSVTSATTKPTRDFFVGEKAFSYHAIKKKAFTGYGPQRKEGRVVLMAEPEKALADFLYFVALGKRQMNDRIDISGLDRKKIRSYIQLFRRDKLEKILKELKL